MTAGMHTRQNAGQVAFIFQAAGQQLARWKSAHTDAGSGTSSELISQRRPKSCSAGIAGSEVAAAPLLWRLPPPQLPLPLSCPTGCA